MAAAPLARWPSATDDSTWDLVKRDALRRRSSADLLTAAGNDSERNSDPYARPQDAVQEPASPRPPMVARRLSGQDITYATLPGSPTTARARGPLPKPPKQPSVDAQGYTQITQAEDEDGYTQIRSPPRSNSNKSSSEYEYAEFVRPAASRSSGHNGYVVPNPPKARRR